MTLTTLILILIIASLVVAALVLGELFFFPGFGLPGILGIAGFIGIGGYLVSIGRIDLAIGYVVASLLFFGIGFWILSRRKVLNKIALDKSVDEVVNTLPPGITKGARGVTRSRLALGGNIEVEGHILYAESEEGFVMEDTPIYISRIENNKVFVRMDREKIYHSQNDQSLKQNDHV